MSKITLFEKKENIGGTWRENTYPGVVCDVPSHQYTYSFEPNPEWSSRYAAGIRTVDGVHHDLDVLVMTTGLNPAAYMRPMTMTGKGGVS